jgi:hypothetical protein
VGDSSSIMLGDRKDAPGGGWVGGCIVGGAFCGGESDESPGGGFPRGGFQRCGSREASLRARVLLLLSFARDGGGAVVVRGSRSLGFCPMGILVSRVCRGPGIRAGGGLLVVVVDDDDGVGLRRLLPSPFGDSLRRVMGGKVVVVLTGRSGGWKGVSVLNGGASEKQGGSKSSARCSWVLDEKHPSSCFRNFLGLLWS